MYASSTNGVAGGQEGDRSMDISNGDTHLGAVEVTAKLLANDTKVKVAGIDFDGVLRGKIMAKDKFLSSVKGGFGMSSAIFGWDMHDVLYTTETSITSADGGYADLTAEIDLGSMRRLPFEENIPMFLLNFSTGGTPVCADGRSMMTSLVKSLAEAGVKGFAGVELEFMNFQTPHEDGYGRTDERQNLAAFMQTNSPGSLRPLTSGMFGYSISRPLMSKKFFHEVYDRCLDMGCPIEGWHTESGPGVFEAALKVSPVSQMADNVSLFKLLTKSIGIEHGVTPCFMAKPIEGLPGNSGHIHVSLTDLEGKNLFARETPDADAPWSDITYLSDTGRSFLAGLIEALPDIMPLLAPNINSYKRLIDNYWAPVTVSWGLEDRLSSLRLVSQPTCKPSATRFEIRIPGADLHPHYALSAIFRAGWRGVQQKIAINLAPAAQQADRHKAERLPNTLLKALERFEAKGSVAREIMGDEFVDAFAVSRHHELRVWREAVTDWEFKRYIEVV
ncbi:hypothetical protein B0J13DRAFT_609512 [Dactylonectria estremocensis]|uniref:GS catalytic domain-containing protein n=1 Tax=Dactylonectria estremocensis TaxID=1079267 RepID=A0A9P9EI18_9HYPO|nr:hypothetical protein B0J13DRAFT_609512 [Dactylonectria estremocensis]